MADFNGAAWLSLLGEQIVHPPRGLPPKKLSPPPPHSLFGCGYSFYPLQFEYTQTSSIIWVGDYSLKILGSSTVIEATASSSWSGGRGTYSTTIIRAVAFSLPAKDQQNTVSILLEPYGSSEVIFSLSIDLIAEALVFFATCINWSNLFLFLGTS